MIRQRWRDLLFVHWPLPAAAVRPLVPAALELDRLDGRAWVTLIPFLIAESRPGWLPRALSSAFLETNLRTYVRGPDGEPGIYFFSLEATSLAAVLAARAGYGLPYFPAAMSRRVAGDHIAYTSRRRVGPSAALDVAWRIGPAVGVAAAGGPDHFLVERYALYVMRGNRLHRGRVRHAPYRLHAATIERLSESLRAAAGLPGGQEPALCHHSPGVDVEILALERADARAGAA
ncbi:MAG TPA: DUF2071 domain-containing protein [Methylomirabilota bacterium]|nr:DUF2071 domain-containing protein [Methylomirabilota bacterium]